MPAGETSDSLSVATWIPRRNVRLALTGAIVLYALSAFALAAVKSPWSDEGWFAAPAYNLAFRGFMGTDVLEPSGHYLNAYLKGIHEHTYVVPPVHILQLAAWFRVFGFSLMAARSLSIVWGAVALLALFTLVSKLVNQTVGMVAVALAACDFPLLWGAADVRMDVPCMAVCLCALASYVQLREKRFQLAFILANGLFAIAFLMHPNALIAFCAFGFLVLSQDRRRLRWSVVAWAALPYLSGLAAWSVYILQAPVDFRIQFLANAAGRNSIRMKGLVEPWMAIWNEIVVRYLSFYGFYAVWISGRVSHWMLLVPAAYCVAFFSLATRPRLIRDRTQGTLLALLIVYFLAMSFFIGFKAHGYLVYILPLYDAVLALWAWRCWQGSRAARRWAVAVIAVFAGVNWYMIGMKIGEDSYRNEYLPCAHYVRTIAGPGKTIYAIAALGFSVPYSDFIDDGRLGFFTHRKADYILLDRSYSQWLLIYQRDEPAVYSYIQDLFEHEYRVAFQSGAYKVYERLAKENPHAMPIEGERYAPRD